MRQVDRAGLVTVAIEQRPMDPREVHAALRQPRGEVVRLLMFCRGTGVDRPEAHRSAVAQQDVIAFGFQRPTLPRTLFVHRAQIQQGCSAELILAGLEGPPTWIGSAELGTGFGFAVG